MKQGFKVVGVTKGRDGQFRFWSIYAGRSKSLRGKILHGACRYGRTRQYFLDRAIKRRREDGPLTVLKDLESAWDIFSMGSGVILKCEYEESPYFRALWTPKGHDHRDIRAMYPGTIFAETVKILSPKDIKECTNICPECDSNRYNGWEISCRGYKTLVVECIDCKHVEIYSCQKD